MLLENRGEGISSLLFKGLYSGCFPGFMKYPNIVKHLEVVLESVHVHSTRNCFYIKYLIDLIKQVFGSVLDSEFEFERSVWTDINRWEKNSC